MADSSNGFDLFNRRLEILEAHDVSQDSRLNRNTVAVEAMTRSIQGLANIISDLVQSVKSMQKTMIEADLASLAKSFGSPSVEVLEPKKRKASKK